MAEIHVTTENQHAVIHAFGRVLFSRLQAASPGRRVLSLPILGPHRADSRPLPRVYAAALAGAIPVNRWSIESHDFRKTSSILERYELEASLPRPDESSGWLWLPIEIALAERLSPETRVMLLRAFPEYEHTSIAAMTARFACIAEDRISGIRIPNPSTPTSTALDIAPARAQMVVALGPPGAGKTATFLHFQTINPAWSLVLAEVVMTPDCRLLAHLSRLFGKHEHTRFFPFQLEVLAKRLVYTIAVSSPALVDESIYSTLAYSRALYRLGWLSADQYEVFAMHYRLALCHMPPGALIANFCCELNSMVARIQDRARRFPEREVELNYSLDYLRALQDSFTDVALELRMSLDVVDIDSSQVTIQDGAALIAGAVERVQKSAGPSREFTSGARS